LFVFARARIQSSRRAKREPNEIIDDDTQSDVGALFQRET
jgi:hypothetical protein